MSLEKCSIGIAKINPPITQNGRSYTFDTKELDNVVEKFSEMS